MSTKLALRTALLACTALALAVPAASADSLVYLDGGNVWTSKPDGSGKVQLTDGGDWHSPTQADDGTIAAVQGLTNEIVVMAGDGRRLRTIATAPAKTSNGGTFAGPPKALAFSPDGTKIAYSYIEANCPVASTCGTVQRSTFVTEADVTEATPQETYGNEFGSSNAEWLTDSRLLLTGGFGRHLTLDDIGPGDYNATVWWNGERDVSDAEVSRDGRRLALLYDYGDNTQLGFYAVSGDVRNGPPPGAPQLACASSEADANLSDPSWSPDSRSVAFESSKGIEAMTFTAFEGGCALAGSSQVVVPGGKSPDWGPAEPAARRHVPGDDDRGQAGPPATLTASVRRRQRFRGGRLSVGCTSSVAGTCTAVATVRAGRRAIRSKVARKPVAAGQTVRMRVAFSKRNAARIRRALERRRVSGAVRLTVPGAVVDRKVTLLR